MADEAHVINVRVRLVCFRQHHRLVPELKPVHARLALGDGEKRFAVHALGADNEHDVFAPRHCADIESGVDAEPFQQQRIRLRIQIVAPFQRDMLGGDDRIFPALKPAVVKAGVHGVAPFQQRGMGLLQSFQVLLECSHSFMIRIIFLAISRLWRVAVRRRSVLRIKSLPPLGACRW